MKYTYLSIFVVIAAVALAAAQQNNTGVSMPGHDMSQMSGHDMSQMQAQDMSNMPGQNQDDGASDAAGTHAMRSMEGHHMDMGPHMKMTALRTPQSGDADRAQKVVDAARSVMNKYKDYHVALNDGFRIFHPEVPQKQYHFTSYKNAFVAAFKFDPERPTSLLYEKDGDGYRLIGLMYTAPKRYTEDDLDQRIPLSVAQWHEHVNFCAPPPDQKGEALSAHPKFGLRGSITTQTECDAAGGKFLPVVFSWMVHVYPLERDAAQIWSVERQHQHED